MNRRTWVVVLPLLVAAGCGSGGETAGGAARTAALTAAASNECAPATVAWAAGQRYAVGARVLYDGRSWQALVAQTAQPGWEPPRTPSLWAQPVPCDEVEWAPQTLYVVGSTVTFAGTRYRCRQAHQ